MQARDVIERKRNGESNSDAELKFLIDGFLSGEVKDYQVSAWLMAVYLNGMNESEVSSLTTLMKNSGSVFPRTDRGDFWVDKHSVGGVGDKTSLLLVPIVSTACEALYGAGRVKLPMVSGRGLGHSGGTLDKLESVPGFSSNLKQEKLLQLLHGQGFFMAGQTDEIAPADRVLYALRDVTATVDCIPLIVSSILSKKLAENIDGLVIDLKWGQGAFMQEKAKSRQLGEYLVKVAKANGVDAVAVMTDMNAPLGFTVGNWLEVQECWQVLTGERRSKALLEVTIALASWMVHLSGRRKISLAECQQAVTSALDSMVTQNKFLQMFSSQGGRWSDFEALGKERAQDYEVYEYQAPREGQIASIQARPFGYLLNDLGGGRHRKEDVLDLMVGFEFKKEVGDTVKKGETILSVYYKKGRRMAFETFDSVISISEKAPAVTWVGEVLQ